MLSIKLRLFHMLLWSWGKRGVQNAVILWQETSGWSPFYQRDISQEHSYSIRTGYTFTNITILWLLSSRDIDFQHFISSVQSRSHRGVRIKRFFSSVPFYDDETNPGDLVRVLQECSKKQDADQRSNKYKHKKIPFSWIGTRVIWKKGLNK